MLRLLDCPPDAPGAWLEDLRLAAAVTDAARRRQPLLARRAFRAGTASVESDREVAQVELVIDALVVDRLQRGVEGPLEVGRTARHRNGKALTKKARLKVRPAGKRAAVRRRLALQP